MTIFLIDESWFLGVKLLSFYCLWLGVLGVTTSSSLLSLIISNFLLIILFDDCLARFFEDEFRSLFFATFSSLSEYSGLSFLRDYLEKWRLSANTILLDLVDKEYFLFSFSDVLSPFLDVFLPDVLSLLNLSTTFLEIGS